MDAGKTLPAASLAAFPGARQKTRAISSRCVLEALEGVLAAPDYETLFEESTKRSLQELMVRAGMTAEEAKQKLVEVEAQVQEKSRAKLAMRAELEKLLGRRGDGLTLRCARVGGGWIFSRYDAIALMLEPSHEGQARSIWDRMLQSCPELSSLDGDARGDAIQTSRTFKFAGQGQQETPVADIRGIVEMLLLVPGRRAAAFRRSVASVFVRYVGGDPLLLEEVEKAAHVQRFLREECPEHPATAFGEAVAAAPSELSRGDFEEEERAFARSMKYTPA